MKKMILGVLLVAATAAAQAGGYAWVSCGGAAEGVYNTGDSPVLNISYGPGGDAGKPGLFWLGVLSADQKSGAVMTPSGWATYQGGLYPFQARYDGGLPGSITFSLPFPSNDGTTGSYVGYSIYAGHGAYTSAAMQTVATRRAGLDGMKPKRVALGTWKAEYDNDDQFIWSLIQKDMVDNSKYGALVSIPYIDCNPLPPPTDGQQVQ